MISLYCHETLFAMINNNTLNKISRSLFFNNQHNFKVVPLESSHSNMKQTSFLSRIILLFKLFSFFYSTMHIAKKAIILNEL